MRFKPNKAGLFEGSFSWIFSQIVKMVDGQIFQAFT